MKWYLYILKCKDESLYTGITTNVERRIKEHNFDNKKGSKALRGKRPVKVVHIEEFNSSEKARKREIAIKHWKREYKLKLINRSN